MSDDRTHRHRQAADQAERLDRPEDARRHRAAAAADEDAAAADRAADPPPD